MKVNDKVVCITDFSYIRKSSQSIFYPTLPEVGKLYTVRKIIELGINNCPDKGIYLTGINSLNNSGGVEMCFNMSQFQSLEDYRKSKETFGGEYDYLNKE